MSYIFYAIISILVADYVLERYLAYLNIQSSKKPLPEILSSIYDADKYAKQQEYFRVNSRFGMITSSFGFVLLLAAVVSGAFGWLDELLRGCIYNEMALSLVFFGVIFIISDLLNTPFDYYDTFVIEERFDFNKVTPKLFFTDKLKGYALNIVIGGGLLALIYWIYSITPEYFWLLAWAAVTAFSLFMSMFYSELIVPLFNRQTPLEAGELRDKIEEFAAKTGFKLKNIYIIDGSKRSTKANAYFSGLGGKKRIVLYDTLADKLDADEIVAVLAHEIGHYKHKHTLKSYFISLPSSLLLFFLLGIILKNDIVAQALGGQTASFHLNLLVFGMLYTPVSLITGLFSNILSRKYEYQADNYAASFGYGDLLISGLKKLSATSLSNLTPHPSCVFFHYSHPTLYQRINNIVKS
ncbi:MAG: M48 family metallopeptidase [Prevotellaceae bacterium]|jgi:STE24 endopeptidase|nr:M48 family metallopeptidase [Prevotellaceae bacterium]